jgi:hypothetical protein
MDLPPEQLKPLRAAGFSDIQNEVCAVNPPADSFYWNHQTIVAPIVRKSQNDIIEDEK